MEVVLAIYQNSDAICQRPEDEGNPDHRFACDAMVLGTLFKGYENASIWPIPVPPYQGFTVHGAMHQIKTSKICPLCEMNKEGFLDQYAREGD